MTENESNRPEGEPTPPDAVPVTSSSPSAETLPLAQPTAGLPPVVLPPPAPVPPPTVVVPPAPPVSPSPSAASTSTHEFAVPPAGQIPGGGQPPMWTPPPTPGMAPMPGIPGAPDARPHRFGTGLAIAAAGVVLAVVSGLIGAVAATQLDEGSPTETRTFTAAPTVDRSSLADIAARLQPSVVSINTGTGEGSGVVLTADGYILTNNHVVGTARGNSVTVTFSDGKKAKATVVGTDPKTDLGVVKADGVSGLTAAKFGDSDAMRVGDTVLALGSPLGLDGSVTAGIVSAMDRTIQEGGDQSDSPFGRSSTPVTSISGLLQTDAAINPGNSGGALANLNGEVVGINTAIATSGSSNGNIGVGFAIPGNRAKQVADQLIKGQKVSHPVLGVAVTTADGGGAVIGNVTQNGPAAAAGLQQGDVITKAGDKAINDSDDLVSAVQSHKAGDRLDITYTRDGSTRTTTVTLGEAS